MTAPELIAVFVLVLAAASVQSFSGFGFGLLVVPLLVAVLEPRDTVVTANVLAAVLATLVMLRTRGEVRWALGGRVLVGSLAGVPAGLAVLLLVEPDVLQVIIGVAVIVSAAVIWRGAIIPGHGMATDLAVGAVSGVLRMAVSMSGPPVVLYFQGLGMEARAFRPTISYYFAAGGAVSIVVFAAAGQVSEAVVLASLVSLPALGMGLVLGDQLHGLASEAVFRRIVLAILVVSAAGGIAGVVV